MKVATISLEVEESNRAVIISAAKELLSVVTTLTDICLVLVHTILLNQKLVLMESLPDTTHRVPVLQSSQILQRGRQKSTNPTCVTGAVR